ncbi:glycosyltransferase EpsE [Rhizobiaceae bacterium]|nr:glycosyltransferase EpsE [Rhizobiaceae bacterium]
MAAASARSTPRISVLIPVRNGGDYVDAAIASMRRQTYRDLEIVVVDDGSSDRTAALLARHAAEDGRIRVLSAAGAGIVDALNQALAEARGDLVARMDADDLSHPDRLARQVAEMDARPDLVLLGAGAVAIDARGRIGAPVTVEADPARLVELLRVENPFLHPTVVMRRLAVEAAGGYRRQFALAEDYDLWTRMALQGVVANIPDALLGLRRHPGQSSRRHRMEQRAVHALARLLAYGRPVDMPSLSALPTPLAAVTAYLSAMGSPGPEFSQNERRDIEKMLRWCVAAGTLSVERRREIAAALRGGSTFLSALSLEWRLRLAR